MNTFSRTSDSDEKTLWPQATTLRGPLPSAVRPVNEIDTTVASLSTYSCTTVLASGGSLQDVCGELIRVVQDRHVQSPLFFSRATTCGKHLTTPQTLIFAVLIPHTLLCSICFAWLLAVNTSHIQLPLLIKILTLFSANFAFCMLLCVWISMFIQEMKIVQKKRKIKIN